MDPCFIQFIVEKALKRHPEYRLIVQYVLMRISNARIKEIRDKTYKFAFIEGICNEKKI